MPQNILQGVVALYRALYRKWRPRKFADVVGQEAIVTALQNQIAAGRIGHAYLFTGTRGTGKTTCAKIFAKAVNCLDTTSPDPCGECAVCKGIDEGTILDVSEIDAASNNSVDDIRDLRDETAYLPAVCKYKVYIIDEVHMLSTSAFNALLKTMEEPPEHVIFILATTEVQKVPATILSRCQRYDFQRITADKIAGRLEYVAGQENIELDHNAAELIGRLADGAMRDALSILDTCAGVSNTVDEALVRRMAGVTDRKYLFEISDAIAARDAVKALQEIAALRQQSVDMRRLCMELAGHYRNLMLSALPGGTDLLTGTSPEEEAAYAARKDFPQAEAVRAVNAFGAALEKMARDKMSVRQADRLVDQMLAAPNGPSPCRRTGADDLCKLIVGILKRQRARGDEQLTQRADVQRHTRAGGLGGLARTGDGSGNDLLHRVAAAGQLLGVGTKGICQQNIRARVGVISVDGR